MQPHGNNNNKRMDGTISRANRKLRRTSLCEFQKANRCDCGSKTGNTACAMAVLCDDCAGDAWEVVLLTMIVQQSKINNLTIERKFAQGC